MSLYKEHSAVQSIAKETMLYLSSVIVPGLSEKDIKDLAESFMLSRGIESFWYYDVGAFVFAGERTALSISGREYRPSDKGIGEKGIVTVDLSPCIGGVWGDYARTFLIGGDELSYGIAFQKLLHLRLAEIIDPDMTFEDIFFEMNREIERHGFRNADYNFNLGHTIEDSKEKRRYIEKGNKVKIRDAGLFTFEPHIQRQKEKFGFKMENIYYIAEGRLKEL